MLNIDLFGNEFSEKHGLKKTKTLVHNHRSKNNFPLVVMVKTYSCVVCIMERVELSVPNAELRLLELLYHKIYKVNDFMIGFMSWHYNRVPFLLNTNSLPCHSVELITR